MSDIWKQIKKERWSYLFVAPPLIILTVFVFIPIIMTFLISFQNYLPGQFNWVGLANYRNVFRDPVFMKAMRNTVVYTICTVPLGLAISLLISALVYSCSTKVQTFFKSAFYLPGVVSGAAMALVWLWIFNPLYGLLNYMRSLVGLEPSMWVAGSSTALFSLILMALLGGGGSSIVLLTAAMGNIPGSLYEVSKIEGGTKFQEFIYITLPLLRPTILYLLIMGTIGSLQIFTPVYMMTQGGPNYATTTVVYMIFQSAFQNFDFGRAAALSLILFAIVATISVVQYRYLSDEIEY
jgi:multiple sugar transport system permease protein